jgi:hypothetical protein
MEGVILGHNGLVFLLLLFSVLAQTGSEKRDQRFSL